MYFPALTVNLTCDSNPIKIQLHRNAQDDKIFSKVEDTSLFMGPLMFLFWTFAGF